MTIEQWRTPVTRWGDSLLGLALLLTPHYATAEATTIKAFADTLTTPTSGELEDLLYAALWQQQQQRRFPLALPRRSALPRELRGMAGQDRFLLGLWLLRGLDGARLATVAGLAPEQVVERLAVALRRFGAQPDVVASEGNHPSLQLWIAYQLGLKTPDPEHPRPCLVCQQAQAPWLTARDDMRQLLRETVRHTHLSVAAIDALEDALVTRQGAAEVNWWRQPRVWGTALIAVVGLLVLLFIPSRALDESQASGPIQPKVVVQAALDAWIAKPLKDPSHQRVWARDPGLHAGTPVVTDVWLAGQNEPRHRVEVHRNGELVEWQVADGRGRFDYGAVPADSSCRWNTGRQGSDERLETAPLKFSIGPNEQRTVRDARLIQGALGTGYLMLQRALSAPDLRSFGTRNEGRNRFALLRFTDTETEPDRQIVLRIDLQHNQLYAVQEVHTVDAQAASLDLWRLEVNEPVTNDVPPRLPAGPAAVTPPRLADPACPSLDTEFVISPRSLLSIARPSYVPTVLPPGIDKIALLTEERQSSDRGLPRQRRDDRMVLQLVGPGRWFTLSNTGSAQYGDRNDELSVGAWRARLNGPTTDGLWSGTLNVYTDEGSSFGPAYEYWARGWTKDQLLTLIDSLAPLDPALWIDLDDAWLDPNPLPGATSETITRAFQALQPEPNETIKSSTTTTVRVERYVPELPDPYHTSRAQRFPATLVRQQWFVYDGSRIDSYHERRTLPDSSLFELLQDDGEHFHWYSGLTGLTYTGNSGLLRSFIHAQPAGNVLISAFLANNEPIKVTEAEAGLLLEQEVHASLIAPDDHGSPQLPHNPSLGGLEPSTGGRFLQRLQLDRNTYRPLTFVTVFQPPNGPETVVRETIVTELERLTVPPADLFALTVLPENRFTIDVSQDSDVPLERITPPTRVLAWATSPGVEILAQTLPPTGEEATMRGGLMGEWLELQNVLGTYATTYRMSDGTEVRLSQGPRHVLRHVLRNQYFPGDSWQVAPWSSSQRFPVTLAGQNRDAWLLQNNGSGVLIVEVDDVLLHFSAPVPYLAGPLLEQLSQLQWAEPTQ